MSSSGFLTSVRNWAILLVEPRAAGAATAADIAEEGSPITRPHTDLEIIGHSSEVDDYGYYHVIGELKNTGATDATFAEIVATFYGADGEVVAVGLIGTTVGTLGPGQTVSFDVQAYPDEATAQIASYALQAQSALPDE